MEEIVAFVNEQPHKLKIRLLLSIYKNTYEKIEFLYDKNDLFKAWICPRLKPVFVP